VAAPLFDVLIVGAGPAGLSAAIQTAEAGARVRVLERMPRAGAKLLATGGGHCNLTNVATAEEMMAAFGRQGKFMRDALAFMDGAGLREFMHGLGVPTLVDVDGFHVFPASRSARDVHGALLRRACAAGVDVVCNARIRRLILREGRIAGVATATEEMPCRNLLLATGGRGYPGLGGGSDGYDLAHEAGHPIVQPVPALTSVKVTEAWVGGLAGVTVPDAVVRLPARRPPVVWRGPLLFTHHGLSGPPILNLSGVVARLLQEAASVPLQINLVPAMTAAAWERKCDDWALQDGRRHLRNLLRECIPAALATALCDRIPGLAGRPVAEVNRQQRHQLATDLAELPLTAVGTGGFDEAMATAGGVALRDVDPRTLRSRLVDGLFFAGEVLDLDGPCGGYNLQWAFSSGALAGRALAAGA
jgi:predicted Rossmann fold flavoprotein